MIMYVEILGKRGVTISKRFEVAERLGKQWREGVPRRALYSAFIGHSRSISLILSFKYDSCDMGDQPLLTRYRCSFLLPK